MREGIELNFDLNLSQFMDVQLPRALDVLIIKGEDLPLYKQFPGLIIVMETQAFSVNVNDKTEHLVILSENGFENSLSQILDLKYRLGKSHKERNSMMNQLDHAIKECSDYQVKLGEFEKNQENRLAMLNHELRTPLNVILGHISLLYETLLTVNQNAYLDRIQKASKHLNETLDEILYYEDLLNGLGNVVTTPFSLKEALDEIHATYQSFAEEKGLNYETFYEDRICDRFVGDINKIELLLKQLLSNSLKFTEKGHVMFSVRCAYESETTQKLEFVIEDTGVGFQLEKMGTFFEPFKQGEHYLQRHYNGLGLGLTIAKGIIDSLGGTYDVWSAEGAGTRFVITLTLEKDSSVKASKDKKACVLIVDDNVLNRKIMKEMLEGSGIEVELARNGKEAVEMVKDSSPVFDLVLMDLIMPVMDGFEASKLIKQFNKQIPIIVISASISKTEIEKFEKLEIDDFMIKNHHEEAYFKKMRQFIYIQEKDNQDAKVMDQLETLKNESFNIVVISELFERYNYRLKLIDRVVEGVNQQLSLFDENWRRLITDPHDEAAMRYFHSLKGLAKSVGDAVLSAAIHSLELVSTSEDYTAEMKATIQLRIEMLRVDLQTIEKWVKMQLKTSKPAKTTTLSQSDLRILLTEMTASLKIHDVKQIREQVQKISNMALEPSCESHMKALITLIENYQYDKAEVWIQEHLEQRGDDLCST